MTVVPQLLTAIALLSFYSPLAIAQGYAEYGEITEWDQYTNGVASIPGSDFADGDTLLADYHAVLVPNHGNSTSDFVLEIWITASGSETSSKKHSSAVSVPGTVAFLAVDFDSTGFSADIDEEEYQSDAVVSWDSGDGADYDFHVSWGD